MKKIGAERRRDWKMALFDNWCESTDEGTNRKRLWKLVERTNGRDAIRGELGQTVRSHYEPARSHR
jgi:hypothetical protein